MKCGHLRRGTVMFTQCYCLHTLHEDFSNNLLLFFLPGSILSDEVNTFYIKNETGAPYSRK